MNLQNKVILGLVLLIAFAVLYTVSSGSGYDYGRTSNVTAKKVRQAYVEINTALYKAQNKHGNFNEWAPETASDKEKIEIFMKNMKLRKKVDCGMNDENGRCWWSTDLLNYHKHGADKYAKDYYTFIDKHNNAVYVFRQHPWGYLMVFDTNGMDKGPNCRGVDIFYFETGPDGVEFAPGGKDQYGDNNRLRNGCFRHGCCASWVLKTGNTEYLKANKNGICKNGKRLTWFNTTCK